MMRWRRELRLSRYTVQLHRRTIMSKLDLHRTPDLIGTR